MNNNELTFESSSTFKYPKPIIPDPIDPKFRITYTQPDSFNTFNHRSFDTQEQAIVFCDWLNKEFPSTKYKVVPFEKE